MNTSEKILELADETERFFKENAYPIPNEPAVRRMKYLCARMGAYDHYIAEKAGEISQLSEQFFSARKHQKFHGGANMIYSRIVSDLLHRIRSRARTIAHDANKP